MNKFTSILILIIASVYNLSAQPKYIFFFIGDGMGLNQVQLTEMYLADLNGKIGTLPLVFSKFPYTGFASSNSLSNHITDSGAGGTALAVGYKTKNGRIGMDSVGTTPLRSIAYDAKQKGLKVGVMTNVSIDHATPSAFYASQRDRDMSYEIALDLAKSNFDFFAGAGFVKPETKSDGTTGTSIYEYFKMNNYTVTRGINELKNTVGKADKIISMNEQGASNYNYKYVIDQQNKDMKLADVTTLAISHLSKSNKGFFLMVESGQIDWACHANDAATAIHEVLDFNEAITHAYNFYKEHPDETLIIVTADHETGGLGLGSGSSSINAKILANQKISLGTLTAKIKALRKNDNIKWEDVKTLLTEQLGFWKEIPISEKIEKDLLSAFNQSIDNNTKKDIESLYQKDDIMAVTAKKVLNDLAKISWASGSHSAAYIPVYAIGKGAEYFSGRMENTDIPNRLRKVAELQN